MNKNYHSFSIERVFKEVSSSKNGLSNNEAKRRLSDFGPNDIGEDKGVNPVTIFLKQFTSILIYILFAAAGIAWFYGKMLDAFVILGVILLNTTIGFIQEYRTEKAIQALKEIIVPTAKVYREGELLKIKARDLVPGDIIIVEEGDKIPADGRIFEAKNFRTVEASLTGESTPISKTIDEMSEGTSLADRKNMVWMGTFVAGGSAKVLVVATGEKTAFGRIAKDIAGIKRGKSHFELKIDKLAKQMGTIGVLGASLIFMIGFFLKELEFQEILLFTIASLVSGIPAGLPAILVIVLALGAGRMARRNAIIRRLPATQTFGVTTIIATDKTGTLTQNTMNVREIILGEGEGLNVTGEGWEPIGEFSRGKRNLSPLEEPILGKLIHIAAICNSAKIFKEEGEAKHKIIGDPTEASLTVLARKAGLREDILKETRIDDLPFNSKLKYRASLNLIDSRKEIYMVGAPEVVIERSRYFLGKDGKKKMTEEKRRELLKKTEELTNRAMRTISLAYREVSPNSNLVSDEMVYEMVFVGTVGIIDPPRPEARASVLKAKRAGIRVIMTTGDHKGTALAISQEVGIVDDDTRVLTGSDLDNMSERDFYKAVKQVNVFARLSPEMKLRIATALQDQGHIVAMTGDGVNDAPVLKKADIGIAMGITGTDVAREASEIVLTDDNFASIVNAIEEGRIVFTNTRQTSFLLITTNFSEHTTLISSLLIFTQLPLLPTQILWLNLVTDGISGLALAAEPSHGDTLKEPPRDKKEEILSKEIIPFLILMTITMAVLTLSFFSYHLSASGSIDKARTAAFAVMAFSQLFNLLNMRSMRRSIFEIGLFSNRPIVYAFAVSVVLQFVAIYLLDPIFHFEPLSLSEIGLIILSSSLVLWFGEIYKYLRYGRHHGIEK